jgi:hypothetical protein
VFFGKPDPLLELQHLAATLSIDELRHIFDSLINHYETCASAEGWQPPLFPIDMHHILKHLGAQHYSNELYGDRAMF